MRIGRMLSGGGKTLDGLVRDVVEAERLGLHSVWCPQFASWDALVVLALASQRTATIELGTAVLPVYPRHPHAMAAAALSTATACGGRFTLGLGPSHQFLVEDMWGYRYDRPRAHLRDYLAALLPALAGEPAKVTTDLVTIDTPPLDTPQAHRPAVLISALAPRMLELAGRTCAGTITWLAGPRALREHIVPGLTRAADGRGAPRVVAGIPVCVTDDVAASVEVARKNFALYGQLPAYRRMLDLEGVTDYAEVCVIGSADQVRERLARFAEAGATDLMAAPFGSPEQERRTLAVLAEAAVR